MTTQVSSQFFDPLISPALKTAAAVSEESKTKCQQAQKLGQNEIKSKFFHFLC